MPTMTVVAGPSGSGKSIRFSVFDFRVDAFNVDDRCFELHGAYQGIPPEVRKKAQEECERFVQVHISTRASFATETTLRTPVAIEQAKAAKRAGFFTSIIYVATDDVEVNIERIRQRGLGGGLSATPETIRDNYGRSLANLADALLIFDRGEVFDNSGKEPRLVLRVVKGRVQDAPKPLPGWVRDALEGSTMAADLESASGG